ncbi:MAG: triose-phosphate isomerase [Bacteroidales bacterium]|nr:triose-phosphate isomerase [Bacteroidales bacterium]MDD4684057.1 triose-phosphate isomerase [Bacteroidales bacterium]
MRRNIVAGNWKMNLGFEEADDLVNLIAEKLDEVETETTVIVCPPYPYLELTSDLAQESNFFAGAQNVSSFDNGAYTGEVSAQMLASMNIDYCIVGHSERRKYFHETNQEISTKVVKLLESGISPIFCCGEALEERESEKHFDVVKTQIVESLFNLTGEEILDVIIAYEPVWAIGTGKTATGAQAQEMHAYIRSLLTEKYGKEVSEEISILYGGSCNPKNAKELFANKDVDGGLIGGASLKADDFLAIITSF